MQVSLLPISDLLKNLYRKELYLPRLIEIDTIPLQSLDGYYAPISLVHGQERNTIHLKDLFKPLDSIVTPSRILITALAGSGKSSLLQKIAYDWSNDKFANDRFHALIKIPLKLILTSWRDCYTSEEKNGKLFSCFVHYILKEDCIRNKIDSPSLAEISTLLSDHQEQLVLLLDGYDEVAPLSKDNSYVKNILGTAFTFSNFVITSRPDAIKDTSGFNRYIEGHGFDDNSVKSYINQYYDNQYELLS